MDLSQWQIVENIVAAVEAASNGGELIEVIPKANVPHDVHDDEVREFDVLARYRAGPRVFSVALDVKDEARPLDVFMVDGLIAKWKDRRRTVDRFGIVSTSGFSKFARRRCLEAGVEAMTMEEDVSHTPSILRFNHAKVEQVYIEWDPDISTTDKEFISSNKPCIGDFVFLSDQGRTTYREFEQQAERQAHKKAISEQIDNATLSITLNVRASSIHTLLVADRPFPAPHVLRFTVTTKVYAPDRGYSLSATAYAGLFKRVSGWIIPNGKGWRQVTQIEETIPEEVDSDGSQWRTVAQYRFEYGEAKPKQAVVGRDPARQPPPKATTDE